MSEQKSSADGIAWNFEGLYSSLDDPKLKADLEAVVKGAEEFESKYRNLIGLDLEPAKLKEAMDELEMLVRDLRKPYYYARLRFAQNCTSKEAGAAKNMVEEYYVKAQKPMIFFELAWCNLDDEIANKIINAPELDKYKHHLDAQRLMKPHQLTENEEKLVASLDLSGRNAFVRLFDETMGKIEVTVILDGQEKKVPLDGALTILFDPDREKRIMAHKAVTEALAKDMDLLVYITNTLVQHHATIDEFRNFPHPARVRNIKNEVEDETVETLKAAIDKNIQVVEKYYKLKGRILGIQDQKDYDRYAPITQESEYCTYEDAKKMCLDAYTKFNPRSGEIVQMFFDGGWIDAELRQGKEGGAFSANVSSDHHPYIKLNFTDSITDAMTMAHELGHGIHQYLAKEQGDLSMETSLCMAETASIFGEMLLFNKLVEDETDPKKKLNLLTGKIESVFASVVRQIMMNRFETKLHKARREQGELPAELINQFWVEENNWMFGDSVEITEEYGTWWSYVLHFIHYPFYTYAYSFGELMVLSLYEQYQKEGESFVPKYIEMLSAGGSGYPRELMAKLEMDIQDPAFWQNGMDLIGRMVDQADEEAKKLGY